MSLNPRKLKRIQWWKQHKKQADPSSDKDGDSRKPNKFKKSQEGKKGTKAPTDSKPIHEHEHEENKMKNRYIIFVGNLPFDLTKEDIIQHFRRAGNVDFRLLTKKDTGKSKGCGFLELDEITSYKKALKLHHSMLGGRKINVEVTCGGGGSGEKRMEKINEKKKKFKKKRTKKQDSTTTDNEDKMDTCSVKEKSEAMNENEESATNEKMDIKTIKKSKKRKQEITEEEELSSTKKKALKESGAITAIVKELQLETLLEDKKTEHLDSSLKSSDKEGKKKKKKKSKEENN